MRLEAVLLGIAASACGRLDFTSAQITGDAAPDAVDAPCPTVWVPVGPLDELNSAAADWSPAWGQDDRQIVFESNRAGDDDLYLAVRDPVSGRFNAPRSLTELNTADAEKAPSLSRSGLEVFFDKGGTIVRATRSSATAQFTAPAVDVTGGGAGADLGNHDLELIYAVNVTDHVELVVRSRASATEPTFGPARAIDKIVIHGGGWPSLSSDGLELFYESGPNDPIYTARRADLASPFSPPVPIPELGKASDPDISPDGQSLLYVVNSTTDIMMARRSCTIMP